MSNEVSKRRRWWSTHYASILNFLSVKGKGYTEIQYLHYSRAIRHNASVSHPIKQGFYGWNALRGHEGRALKADRSAQPEVSVRSKDIQDLFQTAHYVWFVTDHVRYHWPLGRVLADSWSSGGKNQHFDMKIDTARASLSQNSPERCHFLLLRV